MRQFLLAIAICALLPTCVPVNPSTSTTSSLISYTDRNYVDYVGMVNIQPTKRTNRFPNPITSLGESFVLTFDLLQDDYSRLSAKLHHCNQDWQPSLLRDLEFLPNFNEYIINDYQFSQNTVEPYVAYRLRLPAVTKSGNFILAVYDESKLLFTRRLMVFEQRVNINANLVRSTMMAERETHHQINFEVRYGSLEVTSPDRDIKPVILQNHNWYTAITGLTPTSSRLDRGILEYEHFNGENTLPAWNEFRLFDLRTLSYRGQQTEGATLSPRGIEVYISEQKSRNGLAYSEEFQEDLDGNFINANRDPNESNIMSEYAWANFTLRSAPVNGEVYVAGKFNNWATGSGNRLNYDQSSGSYKGGLRLKQGYYNYLFWVVGGTTDYVALEGSHFQTTNEYELLVYYRAPGSIYDRLVGYIRF